MSMKRTPPPAAWQDPIDNWLAWMTLEGRSHDTVDLRSAQIRRLARAYPDGPDTVTPVTLVRWLSSHQWSPGTTRSHMACCRQFYTWATTLQIVSVNPCVALPAPPRPADPTPYPCPDHVVDEALTHAAPHIQLMILLGWEMGLRRGEIARLHRRDIHHDTNGWTLTVHGKGGHIRVLPMPDVIANTCAGIYGYAFPGSDHGHLSAKWVGTLVAKALPGPWTCHSLRHAFATSLYNATHDLLAVQRMLGHARPETTRVYVQVTDDSLRTNLATLHDYRTTHSTVSNTAFTV